MAATNGELADVLERIALKLEVEDASPFRIRAYCNAADSVRVEREPVAERAAAGEDLTALPDVGAGIAKALAEVLEVGPAAYLERLEAETGPGLFALLKVPGLGPARVRAIRQALGPIGLDELRAAAEAGRLRALPGFGEKTEATILRRLRRLAGEEVEEA